MRAANGWGLGVVTFCAAGMIVPLASAQRWDGDRQYQSDDYRSTDQRQFQQQGNTHKISRAIDLMEQNNLSLSDAVQEAEDRTGGTAIAVECKLSDMQQFDRGQMRGQRDRAWQDDQRFNRGFDDQRSDREVSPYDRDRFERSRDFDRGQTRQGTQQAVIDVNIIPENENTLKVVSVGVRDGRVLRVQDGQQMRDVSFQDEDDWGTESFGRTGMGNIRKADEIIGMDVKNHRDEDLGEIKDLVIDQNTGKIRYAVLSFGGFLGLGDKLFAVPWTALNVKSDDEIVLTIEKDRLETAPGFAESAWPDFANQQWGTQIHQFYGQRPYWEGGDEFNQRTARRAGFGEGSRIADVVNEKRVSLTRAINLAERRAEGKVFKAKFRLVDPNELKQLGIDTDDASMRGQALVADVHTLSDRGDRIEVFCVHPGSGEVVKKNRTAGAWRSRS